MALNQQRNQVSKILCDWTHRLRPPALRWPSASPTMAETSAGLLSPRPRTGRPCEHRRQRSRPGERGRAGLWRELHSQVMVGRKGGALCLQPGTPPLCRRRAFGVLDVDHVAQLLLLGWLDAMKYFTDNNQLLLAKKFKPSPENRVIPSSEMVLACRRLHKHCNSYSS